MVGKVDRVRDGLVRLFEGFGHVFLYKARVIIGFSIVVVGCFIGFDEYMLVLSDFLQVFVELFL